VRLLLGILAVAAVALLIGLLLYALAR